MKNRSILLLCELAVMTAVFAFAAAISLKGFGRAELISEGSQRLDRAVFIAHNASEILKAHGDSELALKLTRAEAERFGLTLEITTLDTEGPLYSASEIAVFYGDEEVFLLTSSRQEAAADE